MGVYRSRQLGGGFKFLKPGEVGGLGLEGLRSWGLDWDGLGSQVRVEVFKTHPAQWSSLDEFMFLGEMMVSNSLALHKVYIFI